MNPRILFTVKAFREIAAPISYHFQLRLCHIKAALLPQLMSQILPAFRVLPVPIGLKLGNPDFACFVDDIHFRAGTAQGGTNGNQILKSVFCKTAPARSKRERSLPAPGGLSAVVPAVCREKYMRCHHRYGYRPSVHHPPRRAENRRHRALLDISLPFRPSLVLSASEAPVPIGPVKHLPKSQTGPLLHTAAREKETALGPA